MMIQRLSLCTESNAFAKSTKWMYSVAFHSLACCRMFLRTKICSTVPPPHRNPACFFLRAWSVPAWILLTRNLLSTLLARSSRITPLQLPQSRRFPFLGILHMSPLVHCLGTFSSVHIRSKMCLSSLLVRSALGLLLASLL